MFSLFWEFSFPDFVSFAKETVATTKQPNKNNISFFMFLNFRELKKGFHVLNKSSTGSKVKLIDEKISIKKICQKYVNIELN